MNLQREMNTYFYILLGVGILLVLVGRIVTWESTEMEALLRGWPFWVSSIFAFCGAYVVMRLQQSIR